MGSHNDIANQKEVQGLIGVFIALLAGGLGTWTAILHHSFFTWALWGIATLGGVFFLITYWKVWRKWYRIRKRRATLSGGVRHVAVSGSGRWSHSRRVSGPQTEPMSSSIPTPGSSTQFGLIPSSANPVSGRAISPSTTDGSNPQKNATEDDAVRVRSLPPVPGADTQQIPRVGGKHAYGNPHAPLAAWEKDLLLGAKNRGNRDDAQ